jgi:ubiquinone/menaquinone biosynthesis C-methylase UbiE
MTTASTAKRAYFNDLAEQWDSLTRPPDAEERVAAFCWRACPRPVSRVLDLGCGTGLLAPYLLERLADGGSLVELDFALDMLREGSRKRRDRRIRRVCADAVEAPFPEAAFDAVLCFGILPHLGETRAALDELWRVLRPGGTFAVGHLMGSVQLNALHQSIGGPVAGDTLMPAGRLASLLHGLGAAAVEADDVPERYYVGGEKRAP